MLVFKKKIYSYLYIFFLVLVFFFNEFSTNKALSKNYNISNIEVEEVYDISFDKSKVADKAFNKAFKILFYKLYTVGNCVNIIYDQIIRYTPTFSLPRCCKL